LEGSCGTIKTVKNLFLFFNLIWPPFCRHTFGFQ